MPRISVIMGIYNVGATLGEALDSLFNQTYQDFDVILCDDGSVDNTVEVAEEYKDRYPERITLLRNGENKGLNISLNCCLEYATGEYIARMDGDDISLPTRFERQASFLDMHPEYGFVSSAMIVFDEEGEFGISKLREKPDKMDLVRGYSFCHAPVMIRRKAYEAVNGYTVDRRMLRVEDVDLWFKLYAAGYNGYNMQEPLYMMRDDRNAVSRRKFKYRLNSTYTRLRGFRRLAIPLKYYPMAFYPVLIGLIPTPIYRYLHKKRMKSTK